MAAMASASSIFVDFKVVGGNKNITSSSLRDLVTTVGAAPKNSRIKMTMAKTFEGYL